MQRPGRSTNVSPRMDRAALEQVGELFKVFGDATRLAIMQELKSGSLKVGELVERLDTTQANVSKHLRIMHDARIVQRERRGTEIHYAIDDTFVFPLCSLVCEKLSRDGEARGEMDFVI